MTLDTVAFLVHHSRRMNAPAFRTRTLLIAVVAALTCAALLSAAGAAPSADRVLSADKYTSDKARRLAATHEEALRNLNTFVYHCLPYIDVQKEGIGFFRPKHLTGDERYLALNVTIDQEPSPEFTKFTRE